MTDFAKVGLYYESMSDEELLASAEEGAGAYLPESWAVIGSELARRHLEPGSPEIVVPRETEPARQSPLAAVDRRLKLGVNTAYALAAYLALGFIVRIIQRASIGYALIPLFLAIFFGLAAVRMKRRHSVRAAALALTCTIAVTFLDAFLVFTRRVWVYRATGVVIDCVLVYIFVQTMWAAQTMHAAETTAEVLPSP